MAVNWKTLAGIVAALILGGCVTDERTTSADAVANDPPGVVNPATAEASTTPAELPIAPAAVFSQLDGKPVSLAKLRGKVVFLDFWAPWCPPCRAGLPFTDRLATAFKDKGLVVLGVSGDPAASVTSFMKSKGYKFDAVLDTKNFSAQFGVDGIPHTVVIDRQGRIVAEEEGLAPQAETIRNLAKAGLNVTGFEPENDPTLNALIG